MIGLAGMIFIAASMKVPTRRRGNWWLMLLRGWFLRRLNESPRQKTGNKRIPK